MAKGQIKQKQANTTYIVYMHITPNNKKYIGITKEKNPRERWRKGKGYWTNEHFTSAINKYGWDNIQHIILYKELLKEEAENKEKELIEKYNTTDREYGYNIEKGGCLNKEVSQETRERQKQKANEYIGQGIPQPEAFARAKQEFEKEFEKLDREEEQRSFDINEKYRKKGLLAKNVTKIKVRGKEWKKKK